MGLSSGRGDYIQVKKMASETADKVRPNESLYLEIEENLSHYSSICPLKKICT